MAYYISVKFVDSICFILILLLILSPVISAGMVKSKVSYELNKYILLTDLKNTKAFLFKIAPIDVSYANTILTIGGWDTSAKWDSYYNLFNSRVICSSINIGAYKGDFKITEEGYIYFDLMNHKRFPPLYNNTARDMSLLRKLLKNIINTADVSIKFAGLSGTLITAVGGYHLHYDFEKGEWVSTEIPTEVNITNPWNTYMVWIGNFSWPYKISIRWGLVDGKVKLVHLRGLFPRVIDSNNFIISNHLLQKILSAYNAAISQNKELFKNVTDVYADDINDLAVARMYYDVVKVNGSYYLVPTLWIIPKSFIDKPVTGFYVLIHIFPNAAYGETMTIAGGLSGTKIGGEVPRSLFTNKDPFKTSSSGNSFNDNIDLIAIVLPSIIIGTILFGKLRRRTIHG